MDKKYIEAFGAIPSKIDVRDFKVACMTSAEVELPETFQLNMREVKSQGSVGSCVAHSLAEIVEYFNYIQEKTDVQMSTEFIYGNRINCTHTDHGMIVREALENLRRYGTCPKSDMPCNIEVPDAIDYFNRKALSVIPNAYPNRITNYCVLTNETDMKLWLMTKGPIAFVIKWYKNYWFSKYEELNFDTSKGADGAHCMVIYGWNERGWLFQNSWGTDWGDQGRAVYPYNYEIWEAWGIEDTCYSTYKDDLVQQLRDQIMTLNTSLTDAMIKVENDQHQIDELQMRIQQLLSDNTMTADEHAQLVLEQEQLTNELTQSKQAVDDYAKQLKDAQIQINLLNETIIEIKKPYQNWPKWIVGVINFILNIINKVKKGAKS